MTRSGSYAACLVGLATATISAQQRPMFRATTDAIRVHVSVRDGRQPVSGLSVGDFELLDDDRPQPLQLLSLDEVPIDVTVVVDTSGSVSGKALEQLQRDVSDLTALLRPDDRLRAVSFSSAATEILPLQQVADGTAKILGVESSGSTAFYHAVIAALAARADPERPHLVVVLSDGGDNVSLLGPDDVRQVARRSEAVLQIVLRGSSFSGGSGWMPFSGPGNAATLAAAAAETGGELTRHLLTASVKDLFARVVSQFRTGYVLWFTPEGVATDDWHALKVSVPAHRGYTVTARQGYFGAGR